MLYEAGVKFAANCIYSLSFEADLFATVHTLMNYNTPLHLFGSKAKETVH